MSEARSRVFSARRVEHRKALGCLSRGHPRAFGGLSDRTSNDKDQAVKIMELIVGGKAAKGSGNVAEGAKVDTKRSRVLDARPSEAPPAALSAIRLHLRPQSNPVSEHPPMAGMQARPSAPRDAAWRQHSLLTKFIHPLLLGIAY
jgi:hypothetical protein